MGVLVVSGVLAASPSMVIVATTAPTRANLFRQVCMIARRVIATAVLVVLDTGIRSVIVKATIVMRRYPMSDVPSTLQELLDRAAAPCISPDCNEEYHMCDFGECCDACDAAHAADGGDCGVEHYE